MVWHSTETQAPEFIVVADPRFEPVRDALVAVEERLRQAPGGQNELLINATERLLAAGGKRLRPAISLLSAAIVEADPDRSISLAAGVEMLHTATLVHDDLIDEALLRRGAATLNAYSSPATTVLAGDYLFARAARLVAQTDSVRVMHLFANTLMTILNGEIDQQASRWKIDRQEYDRRIYAKTGALFVLATEAAAELGKADAESTVALVDFGRAAGMAFQIVDDILDYTGNPERTGKPVGSDLRQGLFTLPAILYSEYNPHDPYLEQLRSGKSRDPEVIQALVHAVNASDAIVSSLQEARLFVSQAQQALERLPASIYTDALHAIAHSVIDRTY
jgi:geranylgeranyl pyrophosphate synthase